MEKRIFGRRYKFPGVSYYNGFDWKDYCHEVYPDVDINVFYV